MQFRSEKKMSKNKEGEGRRFEGREVMTVEVRAIDRDNVVQESSRGLKCSFYTASHLFRGMGDSVEITVVYFLQVSFKRGQKRRDCVVGCGLGLFALAFKVYPSSQL